MRRACDVCENLLDPEWVACPYCGRPVPGQVGPEKLVRVITKVGVDVLEVGVMEAEASANGRGNTTRAALFAPARNFVKKVASKIPDVVTTYDDPRRVLREV